MENYIEWVSKREKCRSNFKIKSESENICKKSMELFLVSKPRFWDVKLKSEKMDPKPMIGFLDNPVPLIRNVGSQPLIFFFKALLPVVSMILKRQI